MKRGFTLIELLAVVAIMTIIIVAAVPMFQSMGKRDLGSAATQLRATLRLARQYAVTRRQNIYVVFPDNSSDCAASDIDKLLRSYAVIAQTNAAPPGYEYITDWKYLPQGNYLDDSQSNSGSVFKLTYVTPFGFPFPTTSGSARNMPHICFRPNGRPYAWGGITWGNNDYSVYFTTSRFYSRNAAGTRLVEGGHIAGVTNNVRISRYSGQANVRGDTSN